LSDLPIPEEDIIVGCASGALILDIGRYDRTQVAEESLVSRCIALHNDGRIDLLSLVDKSQFSALVAHRFFILQNFFCEAIPRLEAPTGQMLRTVALLRTIADACSQAKGFEELSANKSGYWPVILTACRHYRLPVPPQFWIAMIRPVTAPPI